MSIENMSSSFVSSNTSLTTNQNIEKKQIKKELENKTSNSDLAAVYEKSKNTKSLKGSKPDRSEINNIISQAERQSKNFEKLISSIFQKQYNKVDLVRKAQGNNLKDVFSSLVLDKATVEKAKKDISEDGYYGVKQTSERILSFAKAVAGNNPKEIEKMKSAVEKGFKQVERMWGGELPDISKETYSVVMSKFDDWQASIK